MKTKSLTFLALLLASAALVQAGSLPVWQPPPLNLPCCHCGAAAADKLSLL